MGKLHNGHTDGRWTKGTPMKKWIDNVQEDGASRKYLCIILKNLHRTDPDARALFDSRADGTQGLHHCHQGIKYSQASHCDTAG